MKVKIQARRVYHKFAELEIEIDHWKLDNEKYATIQDFLIDNDELYKEKIEDKISEIDYEYGFGEGEGMEDWDSEEEWRYDCDELKSGGHL